MKHRETNEQKRSIKKQEQVKIQKKKFKTTAFNTHKGMRLHP